MLAAGAAESQLLLATLTSHTGSLHAQVERLRAPRRSVLGAGGIAVRIYGVDAFRAEPAHQRVRVTAGTR